MFESRATATEFLDRPDCDRALASASYRFMERINRYFGGIHTVRQFLAAETAGLHCDAPLRILDIGSGSCDIPLAISRWARARGISLDITCLETSDHAVGIARAKIARAKDTAVQLLQEDAFVHEPDTTYDYAMASMCLHHFTDTDIFRLLCRLRGFVRKAFLINDLRRSRLAGLAARSLLVGWPPGVRHDALLSIRRGFEVSELRDLLCQFENVTVSVKDVRWFRVAAVVRFRSGDAS